MRDKEQMKEKAIRHVKNMQQLYAAEIENSVKGTKIYTERTPMLEPIGSFGFMNIRMVDIDSVSAIFEQSEGKTAILNFASYSHPGGGFVKGSIAQEESLCHESTLFNVLRSFPNYYEYNVNNLNNSLYTNRALYSPDVLFVRDGIEKKCNVISCAAPNKSSAQKYHKVSSKDNTEALKSRIEFILSIAADQKIDTLILGAFGCGVFKQDPSEVAQLFKEALRKRTSFNKIIFAIPPGRNENLPNFLKVFR